MTNHRHSARRSASSALFVLRTRLLAHETRNNDFPTTFQQLSSDLRVLSAQGAIVWLCISFALRPNVVSNDENETRSLDRRWDRRSSPCGTNHASRLRGLRFPWNSYSASTHQRVPRRRMYREQPCPCLVSIERSTGNRTDRRATKIAKKD